ncbi:hypothetical protein TNCV_4902731 [Trichonephila clavipes]|nr:hypothetical protein TNCV_4902731 [Trichonephila clavipes]
MGCFGETYCSTVTSSGEHPTTQTDADWRMGAPTARSIAPAGSEYAETVLDESRSFFRVHTGYFSNIPKCIKAEFIASWACSQSSVVSSSQC